MIFLGLHLPVPMSNVFLQPPTSKSVPAAKEISLLDLEDCEWERPESQGDSVREVAPGGMWLTLRLGWDLLLGSRVGVLLKACSHHCPTVRGAELLSPGAQGSLLNPSQCTQVSPWSFSSTPTVPSPSIQPVSPPTVLSTSLAADLEGLTLTDTSLVPSVSRLGQGVHLHTVSPM